MKDDIKNKLDNHIKELLAKPSLTNEDYVLLKQKLSELPADNGNSTWSSSMWVILMLMLFNGFGGENHGM